MFEKALTLFERLVVALETLAANQQASSTVINKITAKGSEEDAKQLAAKIADEIDEKEIKKTTSKAKSATATKQRATKQAEPEPENDSEEVEETKKSTRTRKAKGSSDSKVEEARASIKSIAKLMSEDDSDEADDISDALDDLLDEFDADKVTDLEDDQVGEFLDKLKEKASEWFDLEEE